MNWLKTGLPVGACLLLLAVACGDDEPTGPAGGSGGAASSSSAVGAQGGMGGCDPAGDLPGTTCVFSVRGRLLSEQGPPVGNMLTSVVGNLEANTSSSLESGIFSVEVGAFIELPKFAVTPHARDQDKAVFYYPLPTNQPGPIIDIGDLLVLDMTIGGPTLVSKQDEMGAPAQSVVSSGVTLDIPEGINIVPEFDDVFDGAARFDAREVPTQHIATFAEGYNLLALWSFYPFESAFRPQGSDLGFSKARLTFPNTTGLAADTPVELLSYGGFVYPEVVETGTYKVVASGAVSADGTLIELDPGQGVQVLTWIGIRPAS